MQSMPAVLGDQIMPEARAHCTPSMARRIDHLKTVTYLRQHDSRQPNRAQRRAYQKSAIGFGSFPLRDYPRLDPAA